MLKRAVVTSMCLAAGLMAAPLLAQTAPTPRAGYVTAPKLSASTAGYYRLAIKEANLDESTLCPQSKGQQKEWLKTAGDIWAWAIKQKQEWSAGVEIKYGKLSQPDFSKDGFTSDMAMKFVTVRQDGKNYNQCRVSADQSRPSSALLPFEDQEERYISMQILWWYNRSADEGRIKTFFDVAALPLQFIPGVTAPLAEKVATVGAKGLKSYISQDGKPLDRVYSVSPQIDNQTAVIAYLGPDGVERGPNAAQVTLSIETVGSMFASGPTYPDLSKRGYDDIVEKKIKSQSGAEPPLSSYLAQQTGLKALQKAKAIDSITDQCDALYSELRDKLQFSRVDAAVVVYHIIKEMGAFNSALVDPFAVPCIKKRTDDLHLVKIDPPTPTIAPAGLPAPVPGPAPAPTPPQTPEPSL